MIYKNRLKALRERIGVTQKELGTYLGIDGKHYGNFENEAETMPIKHLNNICNYFNVSFDYLLGFTDKSQYLNTTKDIDKQIAGNRLKEFRKHQGLTQSKLASILKVSNTVISDYEVGKCLIPTLLLYRICKTYNISADYLLGKTDKPKHLNRAS